jgi:hypothetical protein
MILMWEKFPGGLVLAEPEGLPPTVLLRATNVRLEPTGTVVVRDGRKLVFGPFPARVRALFAVLSGGASVRYAVAGQSLYRNGVDILDNLSNTLPDMWFVASGPVGETT